MDYSNARLKLVEWLRNQMIGPAMRGDLLGMSPLDRYPCGILFPVTNSEEGLDPAGEVDDEADEFGNLTDAESAEGVQATARRRRYIPPSSVGFSFFVRGKDWRIQVSCSAAIYQRGGERNSSGQFVRAGFERTPLGGDEAAITFSEPRRVNVLKNRGGIDVQVRPYADGQIITVSLFNRQGLNGSGHTTPRTYKDERCDKSLFEVQLECYLDRGEIGTYPRVEYGLLSDEEQELELQYSNRKIYAVGHGAATDWRIEDGVVREIHSDFIPSVEVPQVIADVADGQDRVLDIGFLSALMENPETVCKELKRFVSGYADWVARQLKQSDEFDTTEQKVAKRITARMQRAVERMRAGIALLERDSLAAQAFAFANRAMLDQMRNGDFIRTQATSESTYRWRPFQLAFLLTTIESTMDVDNDYRDTVDLIWFPTGGGKTEAYLGLIAFLIVWRRLKFPETGGGTTTLMRYTLRLLTSQQYLRAARMICALELIRRKVRDLGKEPISVGLWVGGTTSPNTFEKAFDNVEKADHGNSNAMRSLVLEGCPWCGERFAAPHNYLATPTSFQFCCTNRNCDFGAEASGTIPCNVVDEALYESPPTLLIATIDKFARLAWDERVSSFFGKGGNRPPELVIQDELHLIAGALGSIAGLYEAALQTVLVNRGVYPKYIASTATIRMADDQVKRLYGNRAAVFPPPGLSCDDSYFARTVPTSESPGRLYIGYFAPMLDRGHCMAPLSAALLVAPEVVFDPQVTDRDAWLEAWWTQIVYHGSLKGVGISHNAFTSDVRELCERLAEEARQLRQEGQSGPSITRRTHHLAQLTSISTSEENARTFARLEHGRTEDDSLDVVLATNMVSVGLDVSRLALMVINGQPLTTAEYIQASSRVGRSDVPGIVCVNYYRDQARSLSHYENFRSYHESFYRFVEPTSVTPYTYQARSRALHAALVIVVRHSCPHLLANDKAGKFDPNDEQVRRVVNLLKKRCARADEERTKEIAAHLEKLIEQWHGRVLQAQHDKRQLDYQSSDNDEHNERLLFNHNAKIEGLWPTLQSMRNVENSALLKMI